MVRGLKVQRTYCLGRRHESIRHDEDITNDPSHPSYVNCMQVGAAVLVDVGLHNMRATA